MTFILYTLAIATAAYSGFNNLEWYYVIISAILFSVGWVFDRLGQLPHMLNQVSIFQLMFNQIIIYSIVAGVIYFIASGLELLF